MAKSTKSKKKQTDDNISLGELLLNPKARRRLTAQFKERIQQNFIEGLSRNGGRNPLLEQFEQLLDKDRK
jgi:hypothetical protein